MLFAYAAYGMAEAQAVSAKHAWAYYRVFACACYAEIVKNVAALKCVIVFCSTPEVCFGKLYKQVWFCVYFSIFNAAS